MNYFYEVNLKLLAIVIINNVLFSLYSVKDNMKMQVLFPIGKLDTKRASEYVSESAKTVEEVGRNCLCGHALYA